MDLHDMASRCGFTVTVLSDHSYFSSWPLDEKWTDLFSARKITPSFF